MPQCSSRLQNYPFLASGDLSGSLKLRASGFLDRFTTMVGDLQGQAHLFQKLTSNQLIDRVVLNQLHRGSTIAVENRLKLT